MIKSCHCIRLKFLFQTHTDTDIVFIVPIVIIGSCIALVDLVEPYTTNRCRVALQLMTSTVDLVCVFVVCLFVLSFRSKFLVSKPLPRQFCYCPRCLFMMWSGIPAAISVDSATVMEDDWTSICHPNKQQTV